ncbi:unnamed protein product, partial [Meganyctiphanes norvegica]
YLYISQQLAMLLPTLVVALLATLCPISATADSVYWPAEDYGLMKPISGCPLVWESGSVEQDTQSKNEHDSEYLAGYVEKNRIRKEFCMKVGHADGVGEWPAGNYCIYRYGHQCPIGFTTGLVNWEDRDLHEDNAHEGFLPDGDYTDRHTEINYCCRDDGSISDEIVLPTKDPFVLIRNTLECQKVAGMTAKLQYIKDDTENMDDDSKCIGDYPYICTTNEGCMTIGDKTKIHDPQVHYCYYSEF